MLSLEIILWVSDASFIGQHLDYEKIKKKTSKSNITTYNRLEEEVY